MEKIKCSKEREEWIDEKLRQESNHNGLLHIPKERIKHVLFEFEPDEIEQEIEFVKEVRCVLANHVSFLSEKQIMDKVDEIIISLEKAIKLQAEKIKELEKKLSQSLKSEMQDFYYVVIDKQTKEQVSPLCNTKLAAEIWCEENAIDYDYFKIKKV